MRILNVFTSSILAASFYSNGLMAAVDAKPEQMRVTTCLAAQLPSYPIILENSNFKIIQVPATEVDKVMNLAFNSSCGHPINVSNFLGSDVKNYQSRAKQLLAPAHKKLQLLRREAYPINHQSVVTAAIEQITTKNIMDTLEHLTSYPNRSATKLHGVHAASWLKQAFDNLAENAGRQDVKSFFVKTGLRYIQPSLVTVIGKDIDAPAIIIGAHIDTLDGLMPGAGDDASGSASILEAARVLMQSDIKLKRPVYFIWYAAEERGLVGSQEVVKYFINHSINADAAIQFDMTGFRNNANDPTMWVYRDFTDTKLTDFTASLITTYLNVPVAESSCGYGCSDHVSWMEQGVPAAFPCETDFEHHNQAIHSSKDTIDRLNPEHMTNFSKLALAFAIELAGE